MVRRVYFRPPGKFNRKVLLASLMGILLLVIALVDWFGRFSHSESYSSGHDSIPVSAGQDIQFEVKPVQDNLIQTGDNYFVNYRLEREKSRQQSISMLETLLSSPDSKIRTDAQTKWLELTIKISQEGELENLLKIKGFKDIVTDVEKDGVQVLVFAPHLTPEDVSLIQDTVIKVTKIRLDKIVISYKS